MLAAPMVEDSKDAWLLEGGEAGYIRLETEKESFIVIAEKDGTFSYGHRGGVWPAGTSFVMKFVRPHMMIQYRGHVIGSIPNKLWGNGSYRS